MLRYFLSTFFVFIGVSLISAQVSTDYVVLKNGDVYYGHVTEMNDSVIHFSSTMLGDLTLKKADIDKITFNTPKKPQSDYGYTTYKKIRRPFYNMPTWYKAIGFSLSPLGTDIEIARKLGNSFFSVGGITGVNVMPRYDLVLLPLELAVGLYPDSSTDNNFIVMHWGTSFLLSSAINQGYEPGKVFGLNYRHVFANRYDSSKGTFIDIGYRGGTLKREFSDWRGTLIKRTVHLNRLKLGLGVLF
ncbi:MAG: hypothetical protein ACI9JN_000092 [Bacteroidia bacterium]|jgi:hypothetical protein